MLTNFRGEDVENEGVGIEIEYETSREKKANIPSSNAVVGKGSRDAAIVAKKVQNIVAKILGTHADNVSLKSSFFDLGLESLGIFELRQELMLEFNLPRLNATAFFEYPTIEKFSGFLSSTNITRFVPSTLSHRFFRVFVNGLSLSVSNCDDLDSVLCCALDLVQARPCDRTELEKVSFEGAFLSRDKFWTFDHQFWGVSPRECLTMDPQQRVLLCHSWLAFEEAQIIPPSMKELNVGVFIGIWNCDSKNLLSLAMIQMCILVRGRQPALQQEEFHIFWTFVVLQCL